MHCLGAVSGGDAASPTGAGNRGGVMSVVRALGVLVCEGRIQGPPRGYKEGPHCAAPLQASPDDHVCDEDNYLCGRYLVLVREIAERITIGSSLSVEVLMCSDCPCGLARSTCKAPVSIISSTAISQWQHPSDILLEYWSIGVVPSKSPEMMNSQGLYQAVRSRLHFSQVAAWWSRSNGTRPSYVTTRIVSHSEDNLRKFRESPIEHTFPLAGIGDGNSIKVTVWALPRMEEVPTLNCPVHPIKENDEECVARALTPTKNGPLPSSASHPAENLVLPVLVDDRLQTSCDKPGKHHCHCEDEDGCPPSPSIRPNGERKRRRSLPCGPPEIPSTSSFSAVPLPSVRETIANSPRETSTSTNYARYTESQHYARNYRPEMEKTQIVESCFENHTYLSTGSLERSFRKQVSLEDNEDGNDEKRYKTSHEHKSTNEETDFTNIENSAASSTNEWRDITDNCPEGFQQEIGENTITPHEVKITKNVGKSREMNVVVNLLAYRDSTPGTSSRHERDISLRRDSPPCTVHNYSRAASTITGSEKATTEDNARNSFAGKELSGLMSKLSFPKEKTRQKDEGGILEWFSKVPGRVMAVPGIASDEKMNSSVKDEETRKNELRYKNCNLELSQREFNEVLAVLRARTPSGRRRTPVRTLRRREKERTMEDSEKNISRNSSMETNGWRNSTCDKNDVINSSTNFDDCVCPIHRNLRRDSSGDNSVCEICEKTSNTNNDFGNNVQSQTAVRRDGKFSESRNVHEDPRIGRNAVVKSQECVQNVANKADVLLGAILRTNRERKGLVDISNGTKRRNAERTEKFDEATKNVGQSTFEPKVVPFEDEKSLPSVLNKRLHRFKQLFKKEWEKREITNSETSTKDEASNSSQDYGNVTSVTPKSRVKRKIDFANFSTDVGRNDKNPYENLTNDSISGTHQNLRHNNRYIGEKALANGECAFSKMIVDRTMSSVNNSLTKSNATPIAWQNGCTMRTRKQNEIVGTESDDDETMERGVPSAIEQEQFRRSLENAASMVFHSRTGLPLTSSPAPLRRGSCCFDYDSTLNSVSSKRSALFELNTPPSPGAVSLEETDREIETSGEGEETPKRTSQSRIRPQSHALLGSFEESALNGRLEPVSTVHGFTAELGASGSFCPKHRKLPVTVFFYTLGDNDKVSTPYLAHINLGKKGYQVPRSGTIQVTLLNPLGTVVKMFVVLYDLSDMPPRSHTFLRQRTLRDKTLRYLVHLRFMSGKSGRIYLHTDIRMIICRKSDVDTASDFGSEPPKELRSYIHGPTNPKFSPRC